MRKCAVYLVCEDQLGHRMREEQFKAVEDILSGTTKLAELRTGFGKTDVVLFVVALYKGFGKGVRMTALMAYCPSMLRISIESWVG